MIRVFLALFTAAVALTGHPLDPLSAQEITAAVNILRAEHKFDNASRLPLLQLEEPPKSEILAGRTPPRRVFAMVYRRANRQVFEATIDLAAGRTVAWKEVKGVQPPLLIEDFTLAEQVVLNDRGWRAAVAKRGIHDLSRVEVDVWGGGPEPGDTSHRVVRTVSYYGGDDGIAHFRPIEGLIAWVDLDTRKVEHLLDTGVVPLAKPPVFAEPPASGLRPLNIAQPQGPSFRFDGHLIEWDNWRFRYSFDAREGLVLYSVGYAEQGRIRPILYRASLADMVVPYGDPGPAWSFRNAFDVSEYAFTARSMFSMTLGADVPSNAAFLDATFADEEGKAYTTQSAAALYEQDGGVLWRYADLKNGRPVARRARDLVLTSFLSAPPYEYGFNWIFHQDGRLEMVVSLTGIMTVKGVDAKSADMHGHRVAPDLEAVHHQHFFNFRLDFDVDGTENSVLEMNTQRAQGTSSAIATADTPLLRELEARRMVNPSSNRVWKVFNPAVRNALNQPVGYLLIPGENAIAYAAPASQIRLRAGFLDSQLWVTPFDPSERYPAGNYVFQSAGGEGLPAWVARNRPLSAKDLVVWYTLGVTHIPRPEEWPIMPVHRAGFELAPSGFFRSNPAFGAQDLR
jgi:primary-amine oxidase